MPELVVEILSPRTAVYDLNEKRHRYAAAGVPWYPIADAEARTLKVLRLDAAAGSYADHHEKHLTLPNGCNLPVPAL